MRHQEEEYLRHAPLSNRGWHHILGSHLTVAHQFFISFALLSKLNFNLLATFCIQPDFIHRRRLVYKIVMCIIFISRINCAACPIQILTNGADQSIVGAIAENSFKQIVKNNMILWANFSSAEY